MIIADRAQAWLRTPQRKSRLLQLTLIAAVLFHLLWLGSFLLFPRLYEMVTGHSLQPRQPAQPRYATIEMIMQNTKTAGGDHLLKHPDSNPGQPSQKAKPAQAAKASPPMAQSKNGSGQPVVPSPEMKAIEAQTSPNPPGGDPGTGLVSGMSVIPASPDDKHPNLPPAYPAAAGILGQQGTVQMLIHIGANGLPTSVDITQSSGSIDIDETARNAAMGWHFRPVAVNGQKIPSELPFSMQFAIDNGQQR